MGCRRLGFAVLMLALILVGLPALLARGCSREKLPSGTGPRGPEIRLQIEPDLVVSLPLEEYLIGVVAAEMPASFHPEALKAQAVAARTYALHRLTSGSRDEKHPGAHLCADPGHCQAWIPRAEMRRRWGLVRFHFYYGRIADAVRATTGEVLVYQDRLIDPVYHASCGGKGTEDAVEVWGREVPYLKGVPCTWDPPHRMQPVLASLSLQDFFARLGLNESAVPAGQGLGGPVQVLERTRSGRVKKVRVGTRVFRGVDFRESLGLRSTDFTVRATGNQVIFSTRGYGHAVGLCQYGAQGLALQGRTYRQILTYYYRGVQLKVSDRNSASGKGRR